MSTENETKAETVSRSIDDVVSGTQYVREAYKLKQDFAPEIEVEHVYQALRRIDSTVDSCFEELGQPAVEWVEVCARHLRHALGLPIIRR
jgi:hypothetical protein